MHVLPISVVISTVHEVQRERSTYLCTYHPGGCTNPGMHLLIPVTALQVRW